MKPETLTEMERLQLINQYSILEKLDTENAAHYAELQIILQQGYTYLYHKVFDPVWNEELSMEDCRFVLDVFDLHDALLQSYERLEDKEGITKDDIAFWGFDGNNANEAHMSCFAGYMQERPYL
jgi:uncharacterized protein